MWDVRGVWGDDLQNDVKNYFKMFLNNKLSIKKIYLIVPKKPLFKIFLYIGPSSLKLELNKGSLSKYGNIILKPYLH